MSLFYYVRVTG